MAKYVFFKGWFDTVDLFSDEIIYYLRGNGDECIEINRRTISLDIKNLFESHLEEPIKAVIAFNNLGFSLGEDEGDNLWDRLGIPYINILMDHPFHFSDKLGHMPGTTRLFCIDRNHVKYVKRFYPGIKQVEFLPHAGCKAHIDGLCGGDLVCDGIDGIDGIDILYAGTLSRVLIETIIPDFDSFKEFDGVEFSKEVLGELIRNPIRTTEEVIEECLVSKGIYNEDADILKIINAFRFVDGFAVSYFRELAVRILVENGFKVGVLGLGWERCEWADNPNFTLLGKVGAKEVLSYMKRAKVVLNTLTWFKDGAHDRIFNGALCGAAVLTDSSAYLDREFTDGENIKLFDLRDMERIPYIADELVSDSSYLDFIASKGRAVTEKNHTWKNRLEIIMESI